MENYKLNNGVMISPIGYGTFPNKVELEEAIPIAVDSGYCLIDTSDNYNNEKFVGNGYNKILSNKDRISIITKFSQPYKTKNMKKVLNNSKQDIYGNIGEKIDIYLLHWPYPFLWKKQWKRMEKLYLSGECKAIGVCNFEKKHLQKLLNICTVKPMINQFECHPMFQQKETVQFCKDNNIQIMSYSPLARMNKTLMENEILLDISKKYNKSVAQIILRWNVEHKFIPIPASINEEHIKNNIDIFDFELTTEEVAQIDSLESGMRVRFDPSKRFSLIKKIEFGIYSLLIR